MYDETIGKDEPNMNSRIENLPILEEGKVADSNGKEFNFTKEILKKIAETNKSMLNTMPRTREIPLILDHLDNTDAVVYDEVFGYVSDVNYYENLGKGYVYVDIELINDEEKKKRFINRTFRVFSAAVVVQTLRIMHIAIVGDQAIGVANISNAQTFYKSNSDDVTVCFTKEHENIVFQKEENNEVKDSATKNVEPTVNDEEKNKKISFQEFKNFFQKLFYVVEEEKSDEIEEGDEKMEFGRNKKPVVNENNDEVVELSQRLEALQKQNREMEDKILLQEAQQQTEKFIASGNIIPASREACVNLLFACSRSENREELVKLLDTFLETSHTIDFGEKKKIGELTHMLTTSKPVEDKEFSDETEDGGEVTFDDDVLQRSIARFNSGNPAVR